MLFFGEPALHLFSGKIIMPIQIDLPSKRKGKKLEHWFGDCFRFVLSF
jgi:hypothetical protein